MLVTSTTFLLHPGCNGRNYIMTFYTLSKMLIWRATCSPEPHIQQFRWGVYLIEIDPDYCCPADLEVEKWTQICQWSFFHRTWIYDSGSNVKATWLRVIKSRLAFWEAQQNFFDPVIRKGLENVSAIPGLDLILLALTSGSLLSDIDPGSFIIRAWAIELIDISGVPTLRESCVIAAS